MQAFDVAGVNRLRFVFDDTVLSLSLAADATFNDIAQALTALPRSPCRGPIAIDVTVARRASELDGLPISLSHLRRSKTVVAQ